MDIRRAFRSAYKVVVNCTPIAMCHVTHVRTFTAPDPSECLASPVTDEGEVMTAFVVNVDESFRGNIKRSMSLTATLQELASLSGEECCGLFERDRSLSGFEELPSLRGTPD